MRVLILLILLAVVALMLWALLSRLRERAARELDGGDAYRVLETTGGAQAHVFITRRSPESRVLIGSVPVSSDDFDERYAELIALAEDRAATLNASRGLHSGP